MELVTPPERPHFPANPNKFEFDKDVAPIFPNMAKRSIPNYEEAHYLHASIMAFWFLHKGASIIDIGASRGLMFSMLSKLYREHGQFLPSMKMVATDSSPHMCEMMRNDFPLLDVRQQSLLDPEFFDSNEQYDVVNCMYVLQFVPSEHQERVLHKLASMVKPGGILVLGQKEKSDGYLGKILHDQYIDFRTHNGYTRREIEAKTAALANSMWPIDPYWLARQLSTLGFREVQETTRYTVFSTLIAYK